MYKALVKYERQELVEQLLISHNLESKVKKLSWDAGLHNLKHTMSSSKPLQEHELSTSKMTPHKFRRNMLVAGADINHSGDSMPRCSSSKEKTLQTRVKFMTPNYMQHIPPNLTTKETTEEELLSLDLASRLESDDDGVTNTDIYCVTKTSQELLDESEDKISGCQLDEINDDVPSELVAKDAVGQTSLSPYNRRRVQVSSRRESNCTSYFSPCIMPSLLKARSHSTTVSKNDQIALGLPGTNVLSSNSPILSPQIHHYNNRPNQHAEGPEELQDQGSEL